MLLTRGTHVYRYNAISGLFEIATRRRTIGRYTRDTVIYANNISVVVSLRLRHAQWAVRNFHIYSFWHLTMIMPLAVTTGSRRTIGDVRRTTRNAAVHFKRPGLTSTTIILFRRFCVHRLVSPRSNGFNVKYWSRGRNSKSCFTYWK